MQTGEQGTAELLQVQLQICGRTAVEKVCLNQQDICIDFAINTNFMYDLLYIELSFFIECSISLSG